MTEPRRGTVASAALGAAFLMATSAIGPGFLTQTAVFTAQLGASFAFAILISILFDLGAQSTFGASSPWHSAARRTSRTMWFPDSGMRSRRWSR
jgi:hypothetical protein